jgi:hypothetical protein
MIHRVFAFFAGCLLIVTATNLNVGAIGGWWQPQAYLMVAMAVGVVAGATIIGCTGHRLLAIFLMSMLMLGEGWQIMITSDRLISAAEQRQASARKVTEARREAKQRVAEAKAAVQRAEKAGFSRIREAEKAQREASAATSADAAGRFCGDRCQAMHTTNVTAAAEAVKQARADAKAANDAATMELKEATAALDALPFPASATAVADRIGVEPWVVDLFYSVLGSLAITGMAAGLIAYSAAVESRSPVAAGAAAVSRHLTDIAGREGTIDIAGAHAIYHRNKVLPRLRFNDFAVLALACAAHHGWRAASGRISTMDPRRLRSS